jgi:hypothetical protein
MEGVVLPLAGQARRGEKGAKHENRLPGAQPSPRATPSNTPRRQASDIATGEKHDEMAQGWSGSAHLRGGVSNPPSCHCCGWGRVNPITTPRWQAAMSGIFFLPNAMPVFCPQSQDPYVARLIRVRGHVTSVRWHAPIGPRPAQVRGGLPPCPGGARDVRALPKSHP